MNQTSKIPRQRRTRAAILASTHAAVAQVGPITPYRARIKVPPFSPAIDAYKPDESDVTLGWWLNNAILHKMGIRKLGADGCLWIAGDTHDPRWSYCGKKRAPQRVYCEDHARAAYVKVQPYKPKDKSE